MYTYVKPIYVYIYIYILNKYPQRGEHAEARCGRRRLRALHAYSMLYVCYVCLESSYDMCVYIYRERETYIYIYIERERY